MSDIPSSSMKRSLGCVTKYMRATSAFILTKATLCLPMLMNMVKQTTLLTIDTILPSDSLKQMNSFFFGVY